ncbi:peroxiredoxin [Chromatocurvus halotolerans]|uniref:Peroxiredoxin Q/BCP n=1 Tax=Chromatocurvus halotolerans TaxID=1132028 RepID=A0A4V2SC26_9GAMM|nr:peroxiredoxin [Chromatocurvus halotolerans]TCO77780.1 peroxiredoxin Q/BCP [Chromatocurvus halotolerans]
MRMTSFPFAIALAISFLFALPLQAQTSLSVGDTAPDFEMAASDGNTYRLSDFRGKQAVVLAWFPRAFTSGCTVECKSLAQNGDRIREFDVSYFMASTDSVEKNVEFAADTEADFPLLSDPEGEAARAYGVYTNGFAKRHTFYIDADGIITRIDRSVRPSTSAEDMIANLGELGVSRR